MNTIYAAGGERSLRSKVRAQASFFPHPQRHDPLAAPSSTSNIKHQTSNILQLPYGDRWTLLVVRNTGTFTLLEIHNGAVQVRVNAPEAQTIKDYLDANWPVGTKARWLVVPPFKPVSDRPEGWSFLDKFFPRSAFQIK